MAGVYTTIKEAVRRGVWASLQDYYPTHSEDTAPIIFSHLNGTEPDDSYVVISVLGVYSQGRGSSSTLTSTDFKVSYSSAYEVEFRILFVGGDSGDMAHTLSNKLYSPLIQDIFRQEKLGFIRKGNIAYSPVKRETRWVDYHTLDITFTYQVVSEEQIDYFESAIINGIVENEGGVEVYNETFGVPDTTPIPTPTP